VSEIRYQKSAPGESDGWGVHKARGRAAVCAGPRRGGVLLAILPSFHAQRSWTIELRPSRHGAPRAESVVWDSGVDYARFKAADAEGRANFAPELVRARYELPQETLLAIEALVANVSVPLAIKAPAVGLDGTSCILKSQAQSSCVTLEWWHTGPRNWSAIPACFRAVWETLDRLAGASNETSTPAVDGG